MIKKRYLLVLSVAIASVLLGSLLLSNAIFAQNGAGGYDPWLDYNEDGIIDANDLHPLSQAYSSSGDQTKNVNVTNWPAWFSQSEGNMTIFHQTLNVSLADSVDLTSLEELSVSADIDGYTKVTVAVWMEPNVLQWAEVMFNIGGIDYVAEIIDPFPSPGAAVLVSNYEVIGPEITIVVKAYDPTTVSIGLYAVNW